MAAISSSPGSAAASEVRVYIQDDNHDKENMEHQHREDVFGRKHQIARDTAKKKCIAKRSSGNKGNAARWSNDLILRLIDD